jgi:uncharacterized protein (DUF427 family)
LAAPKRFNSLGFTAAATKITGMGFQLSGAQPKCRSGSGWKVESKAMKAMVDGEVVAQSNDVIECKGYQYFPRPSVRMDWLEKVAKTADDKACPHGVQFYDVVVGGKRHQRAAWSYEAPRPEMKDVGGRFGFWQDVEVR